MCLGPEASAVMNGRLISVCVVENDSILAFSAASRTCRIAIFLAEADTRLLLELVEDVVQEKISKSCPPRRVSPLVDLTSNVLFCVSKIGISKVRPPRSWTVMKEQSVRLRP